MQVRGKKLNNEIIFYGGLPRSGSHLLSAILGQNEKIHSEGISCLCRLLWNFNKEVIEEEITQQELSFFNRNNKQFQKNISHSIIDCYYENINNKIILDKNRSWTTKENIDLIKSYIVENPKFIVMTRDIEDIVKSFVYILNKNGMSQADSENFVLNFDGPGSNPLMRPIAATLWAKVVKDKNFLFIDYKDLINDTQQEIDKIYSFLGLDFFAHDFENVFSIYDEKIWIKNLSKVEKRIIKNKSKNVSLSNMANEKINKINYFFDLADEPTKNMDEILSFYNENIF